MRSGRIADNGREGRYIFRDNSPHSYNSAFSDDKGGCCRALSDHRTCSDISVIMNMDIAVAMDVGGKCHVISNDTVVRHVGIDIAVKEPA